MPIKSNPNQVDISKVEVDTFIKGIQSEGEQNGDQRKGSENKIKYSSKEG